MSQLSKAELQRFIDHAAEVYPREACGMVVKRGNKAVFLPVTNVALDNDHFAMEEAEQRHIEETERVIGVIHSHPDCFTARPSDHDIAACNVSGLVWTVVSYPEIDVQEITPLEASLIGRPFILGLYDCWGLMIDWHRRYGIELVDPRPQPDTAWWESGKEQRYTEDALISAGFIMQNKPTIGSMIVMQVSAPVANHAGIVLPDGQLLHHLYGQLSGRTPFGDYWRSRTWYTCRHKDLPPEEEINNVT